MLLIAGLTAFVCVAVDTMAGILVGAVIALLMFVDQMSQAQADITLKKDGRNVPIHSVLCLL
jgi:MFS superfamily sulfate permease-like transporter